MCNIINWLQYVQKENKNQSNKLDPFRTQPIIFQKKKLDQPNTCWCPDDKRNRARAEIILTVNFVRASNFINIHSSDVEKCYRLEKNPHTKGVVFCHVNSYIDDEVLTFKWLPIWQTPLIPNCCVCLHLYKSLNIHSRWHQLVLMCCCLSEHKTH